MLAALGVQLLIAVAGEVFLSAVVCGCQGRLLLWYIGVVINTGKLVSLVGSDDVGVAVAVVYLMFCHHCSRGAVGCNL